MVKLVRTNWIEICNSLYFYVKGRKMNRADAKAHCMRVLEGTRRWNGDGVIAPKGKAQRVYDYRLADLISKLPK